MAAIAISSGHGKYIRGARGNPVPPQLDEVDQARRVVAAVAENLKSMGVTVRGPFNDDVSRTQNENLNRIVNWHNSQTRDLDVSVHFNAFDHSAQGTECLYVTQQSLAGKVASAVAAAGTFTNRGPKKRTDLFFLNNTAEPAILIETCFCDNTSDSNKYTAKFAAICRAIAEAISGQTMVIPDSPPEPEPAPEPEPGEPARIEISAHGNVVIVVNGKEVYAPDGIDSPAPSPGIPPNHRDIFATKFGGSADPNYSAYPPFDANGNGVFLNDADFYVALPANVGDAAMRERGVRVYNRKANKNTIAKIWDKGPWMVNDTPYVFGSSRPIAETCYRNRVPLPEGPNAGRVPANPAGIDLSPALFRALGMTDNGPVDWEWVPDPGVVS